jgi:hypothetical protein
MKIENVHNNNKLISYKKCDQHTVLHNVNVPAKERERVSTVFLVMLHQMTLTIVIIHRINLLKRKELSNHSLN